MNTNNKRLNTTCVHHFIIDQQLDGLVWHGRCKKCGAKKDFPYLPRLIVGKRPLEVMALSKKSLEWLREFERMAREEYVTP